MVILDIFASRANTREGKIQVELAQLKYPVEYSARILVHYDGNQFVCDSGAEEFIDILKSINKRSAIYSNILEKI